MKGPLRCFHDHADETCAGSGAAPSAEGETFAPADGTFAETEGALTEREGVFAAWADGAIAAGVAAEGLGAAIATGAELPSDALIVASVLPIALSAVLTPAAFVLAVCGFAAIEDFKLTRSEVSEARTEFTAAESLAESDVAGVVGVRVSVAPDMTGDDPCAAASASSTASFAFMASSDCMNAAACAGESVAACAGTNIPPKLTIATKTKSKVDIFFILFF